MCDKDKDKTQNLTEKQSWKIETKPRQSKIAGIEMSTFISK